MSTRYRFLIFPRAPRSCQTTNSYPSSRVGCPEAKCFCNQKPRGDKKKKLARTAATDDLLAQQDVALLDAQYLAAVVQFALSHRAFAVEVTCNGTRPNDNFSTGRSEVRERVTDGQAHQVKPNVFRLRQLAHGRPEEHALVVRMSGDQQHPATRLAIQVERRPFARPPQTSAHVSDHQHGRGHEHNRIHVHGLEDVLIEHY